MKDIPADVKDDFYNSAHAESEDLLSQLRKFNVKERGLALDFGSGVGRLSVMLHRSLGYKHVIGIDQSVWHSLVSRQEAKRMGVTNVQFIVSGPDLLRSVKGLRFDLVMSVIVLQHMVPSLMLLYIEQFCDVLNVGGHGYFQVPTYLKADYSQFKCDYTWSIQEGGMQVWYLEHEQVQEALSRRGCRVLSNYPMDSIGIPESKSELFFFVREK